MSQQQLTMRDRGIIRALSLTLILNLLVATGKLVVGIMTGRVTVIADGLHSFLDGANNVIGIVAIRAAAAPPDAEHPYGHRKFENIAAMLIGGVIFLVCWQVFDLILHRLWNVWKGVHEAAPTGSPDLVHTAVILGALIINIGTAWWEHREGNRLASPLLRADAGHTASDSLVTMLSLGSLWLGGLAWWVDPLLAAGVLFFLVRAALTIIRENLPAFTDRVQLDPKRVAALAEGIDGVLAAYDIRSHGMESDIHLDLSIVVPRTLTAEQTEDIEELVRERLQAAFPGLTLVAIHHSIGRHPHKPTETTLP